MEEYRGTEVRHRQEEAVTLRLSAAEGQSSACGRREIAPWAVSANGGERDPVVRHIVVTWWYWHLT